MRSPIPWPVLRGIAFAAYSLGLVVFGAVGWFFPAGALILVMGWLLLARRLFGKNPPSVAKAPSILVAETSACGTEQPAVSVEIPEEATSQSTPSESLLAWSLTHASDAPDESLEKVQAWLNAGADPNVVGSDGDTAFVNAVVLGASPALVRLLWEAGGNARVPSLLMRYVSEDANVEVLDCLIAGGVLEVPAEGSDSPLLLAVQECTAWPVIRRLLAVGQTPGTPLVPLAAVEEALANGAPPEVVADFITQAPELIPRVAGEKVWEMCRSELPPAAQELILALLIEAGWSPLCAGEGNDSFLEEAVADHAEGLVKTILGIYPPATRLRMMGRLDAWAESMPLPEKWVARQEAWALGVPNASLTADEKKPSRNPLEWALGWASAPAEEATTSLAALDVSTEEKAWYALALAHRRRLLAAWGAV